MKNDLTWNFIVGYHSLLASSFSVGQYWEGNGYEVSLVSGINGSMQN